MFRGATPATDRLEAYKAKVRAFSGTGTPPDYTPSAIQGKLAMMCREGSAGVRVAGNVPERSIRSPLFRQRRSPGSSGKQRPVLTPSGISVVVFG
jgi:hypothetical protein